MFNIKNNHYYKITFFDDVNNIEWQCLYCGKISDTQTLRQRLKLSFPKYAIKVIKISKSDFLRLKHHRLIFTEEMLNK